MRAKKFFVNIGWAALYLSLFLIASTWASMVFTVGDAVARVISTDGAMSDSSALMDAVLNDVYDMTDILQLMVYVTLLGMLAALLIAQQEKSLPRAVGLQMPCRRAMLWAPPLVGFSLYFATTAAFALVPEDAPLMQEYIQATQSLEMGAYEIPKFIMTVIGAPIVEEILFRGLIYKHLKRAMPVWLALVIQAVLFGAVHGQLLWAVFAFVLAIALGLTRDYFDSLWPCIAIHLCFNGANYLPIGEMSASAGLVVLLVSLLAAAVLLLVQTLYARTQK